MGKSLSTNWVVIFVIIIVLTGLVLFVVKYINERKKNPEEEVEAVINSISSVNVGSPGYNRQIGQAGVMSNMGVVELKQIVFMSNNDYLVLMAEAKDTKDLRVAMVGKLRYRGNRMLKFEPYK